MLGDKKSFWKRKRVGICVFLAVVVASLFVCFYEPSSPDGIYSDRQMQHIGSNHGYWILKDGKFYMQCDGGAMYLMGSYFRTNSEWALLSERGETGIVLKPPLVSILKPTLFGLKVVWSNTQYREVFWPRNCFSFVVNCKVWAQLHLL